MTAILLAGRTGAAFAAEIGTMRVNEEINALTTMGLDPVVPVTTRVIAAVLMTPLLSIFAMSSACWAAPSRCCPSASRSSRSSRKSNPHVTFGDFMSGWVKSFVFAMLIAGIGCLRGLQTSAGASAVGDSATRAVVSGIVLIVVIDGMFAVIYFMLDI